MFLKQLIVKSDAAIILKDLIEKSSMIYIDFRLKDDINTTIINKYYKDKIHMEEILSYVEPITYAAISLDYFLDSLDIEDISSNNQDIAYKILLSAAETLYTDCCYIVDDYRTSTLDKQLIRNLSTFEKRSNYSNR